MHANYRAHTTASIKKQATNIIHDTIKIRVDSNLNYQKAIAAHLYVLL